MKNYYEQPLECTTESVDVDMCRKISSDKKTIISKLMNNMTYGGRVWYDCNIRYIVNSAKLGEDFVYIECPQRHKSIIHLLKLKGFEVSKKWFSNAYKISWKEKDEDYY